MALFGKKKASTAADGAADASVPSDANSSSTAAPPVAASVPASQTRTSKSKTLRNGSVVGVNIGNAFIKGVEVTAKAGAATVTGLAMIPTPPDGYANGAILSDAAMIAALRELWKVGAFKSRIAVLSMAGTSSLIVRVIEVPKMTDGQLADNMKVDADRYIPFPPSEVIMDFKALRELPSDPDAANMHVLLAAAQREVVDAHVRITQKARLDPRAIDVEPLAAVRAMQIANADTGEEAHYDELRALLNIGATGTEVTLVRGDSVVFTRTVPIGGNNLTGAVADALELTTDAAESLKRSRGDALPPAGMTNNASRVFNDDLGDTFASGDDQTVVVAPASAGAATGTASATSGSDDPFDLDFFNQEPGAGHGQKETGNQDPFSFSFSEEELPSTTGSKPPSPTSKDAGAASNPASKPAPDPFGDPFSAELPEEFLPSVDPNPSAPQAPQSASASAPMPSAFEFSDLDLPAQGSSDSAKSAPPPAKNTGQSPTAAPSSGGFNFSADAEELVPAVATTPIATAPVAGNVTVEDAATDSQTIVIRPTSEPKVVVTDGATDEAIASSAKVGSDAEQGDFDLDDLFAGDNTNTTTSVTTSDADAFGTPSAAPADDFGFGGAAPGGAYEADDMSTFGVGLVAGSGANADEAALYGALHGPLEELAAEVRRSLEFYLDRQPDAPLTHLYLTGGGARLRNLDVYFTQSLGVPTSLLNPFGNVAVSASKPGSDVAHAHSVECAVALALAMRDIVE